MKHWLQKLASQHQLKQKAKWNSKQAKNRMHPKPHAAKYLPWQVMMIQAQRRLKKRKRRRGSYSKQWQLYTGRSCIIKGGCEFFDNKHTTAVETETKSRTMESLPAVPEWWNCHTVWTLFPLWQPKSLCQRLLTKPQKINIGKPVRANDHAHNMGPFCHISIKLQTPSCRSLIE